jgi:hypothetical protein
MDNRDKASLFFIGFISAEGLVTFLSLTLDLMWVFYAGQAFAVLTGLGVVAVTRSKKIRKMQICGGLQV